MPIVPEEDYLAHYGVLRRSGRYPWGSGGPENASTDSFLGYVTKLRKDGLTDPEIAKGMGTSTIQLRAAYTIARNEKRAADIAMAQRLKDKGYHNKMIAERMNLAGESSVRALLAPGQKDRAEQVNNVAKMLRDEVGDSNYLQIGTGVENQIGITDTKLKAAVALLKEDGYEEISVQVDASGQNKTTVKVLAPPGTKYLDVKKNLANIKTIEQHTPDGGDSFLRILPPKNISLDRVAVRYGDKGGAENDGTIFVRPGVEDVSLGGNQYAQVRVAVNGTHYLKGMAVYKDDLPKGVDLVYNSPKKDTGNKLDAMKEMKRSPDDPSKIDEQSPFGAYISRQIRGGPDGKGELKSVMNIVNEEGDWYNWSKNLSTQFLSKQSPDLVKKQLDETYARKQADYDEINSLTNPVVKKRLLESFADDVDSSAVHLKAAALPRQLTSVILPVNSLKDNEVYAPAFRNGERVVLVRYPHGGKFEIPELVVNNNNPEGKKLITPKALDAVGINSRVAERLSGADFDGDSVLVIPNNSRNVKNAPPLTQLKNFDAKASYKGYDGMKTINGGVYNAKTRKAEFPEGTKRNKNGTGKEMGDVSNLITDMTLFGAKDDELARAVRHSMVVIDAEKHGLDYKRSAVDNGIAALKQKYQGGANKGAASLISRATAEVRVDERKMSYRIDPVTGVKTYNTTGRTYVDSKGETVKSKSRSTKLAETDDAYTLVSDFNTPVEKLYAEHSNRLKAMANAARRDFAATPNLVKDPAATKVYAKEVESLNAKLNESLKNRPRERQARILADTQVSARIKANPDMEEDEIKKLKAQAIEQARYRVGSNRKLVEITDNEWEAIQAGAISGSKLNTILDNADLDRVRELATPRSASAIPASRLSIAKTMLNNGHTLADIADAMGVPLSLLKNELY